MKMCFLSITFLKFILLKKLKRETKNKKKNIINWLEKENNTHNNKKIEAVGGIIIMDIFLVFVGDFDFFVFSFFNFSQFMQR